MRRRFASYSIAPLVLSLTLATSNAPLAAGTGSKTVRTPKARTADPLAPPAGLPNAAERQFAGIVSTWTRAYFENEPGFGTTAGLHQYDDKLAVRSRESIDRTVERDRKTLADLSQIHTARLSSSSRIDYELFQRQVEGEIFSLTELKGWETDPATYNYAGAIHAIVARTYATPEARLRSVAQRLSQVPALLESGKRNLQNPPEMFTGYAIEEFQGTIDFLDKEVPEAFASVKDPALWERYNQAKQTAVGATRNFIEWLKTDLQPRSKGSYILGEDRYRRKLHYDEMVDMPLDSILDAGSKELARLAARWDAAAQRLRPGATPEALLSEMRADHPKPDELIPYVKKILEEARSFAISSGFIAIPSQVRCRVRPTPSFEAERSFASLDSPGPFEKEANEAYYNITLPNPAWDSTRTDQHMQGFNRWTLPSVSIHEAYPGHYVHYLYSKRAPSLVRKTMGCGSFSEGWGLYVEEGLIDKGFAKDDPRIELGMLRWALVRACRLQVGIRVHTRGMTMDQAIATFMEKAHMERANAEREAYRAAFDPTYCVYTLGALQIRKLRDDVARAQGRKFDLARFHASMLSQGSLPVSLLRRVLLNGDQRPTL